MAFFTSSSTVLTGFEQKVAEFHCFLHQNYGGPNRNQEVPVNPGAANSFGVIAINDWVIRQGSDSGSRLVARAQGLHTGSGQTKEQWNVSFNMLFEDASLKGSSLIVRGAWEVNSPVEWAIVGGTGKFTFAQGVVYGTKVSQDGNGRVMELFIHITYRPVEKPNMN